MPANPVSSEPVSRIIARGRFFCPVCMEQRGFRQTEVLRALHLGPLRFRLGRLGEYVECEHCLSTFRLEVLAYDAGERTPYVRSEYQRALKRILALMVMVDGVIEAPEIETVRRIFRDVAGIELEPEEVEREVHAASRTPTTVARYLARVVGYLNSYGKEQVLKGAVLVSCSDGDLHPREAAIVRRLAGVLHVADQTVDELLAAT